MRFRVVAVLAAGVLALGGGAVANASTTAHQNPASSAAPSLAVYQWVNVFNGGNMWYSAVEGRFFTESSLGTRLTQATDCNASGCEHELNNSNPALCLAFVMPSTSDPTNNYIAAEPCNGANAQRWNLVDMGNSQFVWDNPSADYWIAGSCANMASTPALTVGQDDVLHMSCPTHSNGDYGTSQEWSTAS